MATLSIAAASCGGKSVFDRAAILREAHGLARHEIAMYRAAGTLALSGLTYRKAFGNALRSVWRMAKEAAEMAAYDASLPPIPSNVADRIAELRAEAEFEPITMRGNDRYSALYAQARDLADTARGLL